MLDDRLSRTSQLRGASRGLADAAILPFVRQFAAVDREWFAAQPIPHLQSWLAGHLESPLFTSVMGRFPPWTPSDQEVALPLAVREMRPLAHSTIAEATLR